MNALTTLDFETFWKWLTTHPNCILRAGTPESVLYDDEDLHWHFAQEGDGTLLVQTLRGKRLLAEFFLDGERIAYVHPEKIPRNTRSNWCLRSDPILSQPISSS